MTAPTDIVRDGLAQVGFGPQRMADALDGAPLFGRAGLLNSLELVQFVAGLSERTGIDAFDFMKGFDNTAANPFQDVATLAAFLGQKLALAAGARR